MQNSQYRTVLYIFSLKQSLTQIIIISFHYIKLIIPNRTCKTTRTYANVIYQQEPVIAPLWHKKTSIIKHRNDLEQPQLLWLPMCYIIYIFPLVQNYLHFIQ